MYFVRSLVSGRVFEVWGMPFAGQLKLLIFAMMFQRQGVRDSSPEALPFLRHSEGRIFALPGTFH